MALGSGVWDWILGGIKHLVDAIKLAAAGIIARVLSTFGLTMVTFNGVLPDVKSYLQGYLTGMPAKVLELASAVGLDIAMTMIVSALTIRMAWSVFIIPNSAAQSLGGGNP